MAKLGMWILAGLMAVVASRCAAAELTPEVVVLRHRTAEQVLPLIQPLVPKPGTVTGMGNELVIQTTRANLADVKKVLEALDRAAKRLLITVRQDADEDRGSAAQVYGTRGAEADQHVQRVQVIEGGEASISIGRSVPVVLRGTNRRVVGGRVVDDRADIVEFRDVLSGFTVRPRLAGASVVMDIGPQRDTPGDQGRGSTNVQRIATTLSGRLGEWIEVGAVMSGQQFGADAAAYSTRSTGSQARRILVKVELLD